MEKSQQSYYTLPFYKKVWYNIKNYISNKISEFKFPYAFVIFFALFFYAIELLMAFFKSLV